ncbi:MAG: methyltransferase domain-containing protein [Actinobacteria bacterium]|nr:methyltransferase domain-containing protein [Actinomycetota bacterium]
MFENLVCPKCKNNLTRNNESLSCRNCNQIYTIIDDIYDFLDDADSYFSELPIEETDRLLNDAKKNGWRSAVREIGFKYPSMNEIFLNNAKVDWLFHCLDLSNTNSCLEIGSGWGTTAFCLAQYFNEVWSLDSIRQKLEFQRIRQNQEKINNIKFIRASLFHLPFQDNYFDLVAIKNVIDRRDIDSYSRNPRTTHLYFFKEIKRILKPNGCLYLGSPNKIKFSSFLRGKNYGISSLACDIPDKITELHDKNHFGKNNEIKNESKIKRFQFFSYSFFGYKKILKEAGFSNNELYWTIEHNRPKISGRFDGESFDYILNNIKKEHNSKSFKSSLQFIAAHLPRTIIKHTLPFVSPSFLIFAYKDYKNTTFESKLLQLESPISSFLRISGSPGVDSKIIYLLFKNGRPHSVIKFPRFKGFVSLISEEEKMKRFNKLDIKRKDVDSVIVFIEPFFDGERIDYYNITRNRAILNWLIDFQKQTQKGFWDFNELKIIVNNLSKFLSDIPIDNEIRIRIRKKLEIFLESLSKIQLPKNSEHGDFSNENIYVGKDDNKVYVTDWEFYNEEGDPLFDFVFFILCCSSNIKHFPQAFLAAFNGKGQYAEILNILISEFCEARGLPRELILKAVPYVILRFIYRTTFITNYRHINPTTYITLLKVWDEMNLTTSSD